MQTRPIANPANQRSDFPASGGPAAPHATARLVKLEQGLYALGIGAAATAPSTLPGIALPAIQISAPLSNELDPVEIVASSGEIGSWLGPEGGTVVIRSPQGGGYVLITSYGTPEQAARPLEIDIRRLDRPGRDMADTAARGPAPAPASEMPRREIPTEISLHMERAGDLRFPGQGWAGHRGQKLRIEAFSIRPTGVLSPADIEYMAFGPNGRETPWVSEAKLCGTRGRGLPLTGFAVRLAPHLRDRYSVTYQGSFFSGGVVVPAENGSPCTSTVLDDPLEAISVQLVERAA